MSLPRLKFTVWPGLMLESMLGDINGQFNEKWNAISFQG